MPCSIAGVARLLQSTSCRLLLSNLSARSVPLHCIRISLVVEMLVPRRPAYASCVPSHERHFFAEIHCKCHAVFPSVMSDLRVLRHPRVVFNTSMSLKSLCPQWQGRSPAMGWCSTSVEYTCIQPYHLSAGVESDGPTRLRYICRLRSPPRGCIAAHHVPHIDAKLCPRLALDLKRVSVL